MINIVPRDSHKMEIYHDKNPKKLHGGVYDLDNVSQMIDHKSGSANACEFFLAVVNTNY